MATLDALYLTDLHGDAAAYVAAAEYADLHDVPLLLLGGDLLPKESGMLAAQLEFVDGYLRAWLGALRRRDREVWLQPGNDDCRAVVPRLDALEAEGLCRRLDRGLQPLGETGFQVFGDPYVPEYPFGLKDWVRLDRREDPPVPQLGPAFLTASGDLELLPDHLAHLAAQPSIAEELAAVPAFSAPRQTLVLIHAPPSDSDLDVCWDGRRVGSVAVREFLEQRQPLLALHGHIHESPQESGVWRTTIGETVAVQPGPGAVRVVIDGEDLRLERVLVLGA